jgi:solute carrier family 25 phosphate transporter 23/24/25/41
VATRYNDGRGAARVDKEGDINVSFPRPPGSTSTSTALFGPKSQDHQEDDFEDTVEEAQVDHHEAWRFLLAGGVAGAGTHISYFED